MSSHIFKSPPESKLPCWQPPTWKVLLTKRPCHSCLFSLSSLSCSSCICCSPIFLLFLLTIITLKVVHSHWRPYVPKSLLSFQYAIGQISICHWISPHECPASTLNSTEPKLDTLPPALLTHSVHYWCNLPNIITDHLAMLDTWKSSPYFLTSYPLAPTPSHPIFLIHS